MFNRVYSFLSAFLIGNFLIGSSSFAATNLKFKQAQFQLPNVRAGQPYKQNLSSFVDNKTGSTVVYFSGNGASWVKVLSDGTVTVDTAISPDGTVPLDVQGTNSIQVTVKTPDGTTPAQQDSAVAQIEVDAENQPPEWEYKGQAATVIPIGDVERESKAGIDLTQYVSDPDKDYISFSVVDNAGAPWFSLKGGEVDGIPTGANSQLKTFKVVVAASDNMSSPVPVILTGRVVPKNNPPLIDVNPIKIVVKERSSIQSTLLKTPDSAYPYVSDPNGDALTFTIKKPDASYTWIELTSDGTIKLNPKHEQIGTFNFPITVSDKKTTVPGTIQVVVLRDPLPPQFTQKRPFNFTIKAGDMLNIPLKDFAKDAEGFDVTYAILTGPKWMLYDPGPTNPRLYGRPSSDDVGLYKEGVLRAQNSFGSFSDGAFTVQVAEGNHKPQWSSGQIVVRPFIQDVVYSQSLVQIKPEIISDQDPEDKGKLKFRSKPVDAANDWAYVNKDGLVYGLPDNTKLMELDVTAVDTHGATATTRIQIPYKAQNLPPEWKVGADGLVDLGTIPVGTRKSFDLADYVKDADDSPLSLVFEKTRGDIFAQLVGQSQLVIAPTQQAEIRQYTLSFTVTDEQSDPVEAGFKFTLVKKQDPAPVDPPVDPDPVDPDPVDPPVTGAPIWLKDPIAEGITVNAGTPFTLDLSKAEVASEQGAAIYFKKATQCKIPWISVSVQGVLKLDPPSDITGTFTCNLIASTDPKIAQSSRQLDPSRDAIGKLVVLVQVPSGPTEPGPTQSRFESVVSDRPKGGNATAEILFVLDNFSLDGVYTEQRDYYDRFKVASEAFFAKLNQAGINYRVAVISARNFDGKIMGPSESRFILTPKTPGIVREFSNRIDQTKSVGGYVSHLASLSAFFEKVPESVFNQTFLVESEPLFVMFVAHEEDQYKKLMRAQNYSMLGKVADPAEMAKELYKSQSYSVKRPMVIFGEDGSAMGADGYALNRAAFYPFIGEQRGLYWGTDGYKNNLDRFADEIVRRSYRYAHKSYTFENPTEYKLGSLQVTLISVGRDGKEASQVLKGGKGRASDQWSLNTNGSKHSIVINWWNIQQDAYTMKSKVVIDY